MLVVQLKYKNCGQWLEVFTGSDQEGCKRLKRTQFTQKQALHSDYTIPIEIKGAKKSNMPPSLLKKRTHLDNSKLL